jgi:hypothetical protein
VEGARALTDANGAVFRDPRSHVVYDDAKAWLARAEAPWDIVVSEPSNPWVSGVASLFTAEMYERIARRLAPGGVLVQWIQLYEIDPPLLASIVRALVTQFPHYVAYVSNDSDLIVIAARDRRPVVDAAKLFAVPGMQAILRAVEVADAADLQSRWRGDDVIVDALLGGIAVPANSDFVPFVDRNAARARFARREVGMFLAPIAGPVPMDVLGVTRPRDGDAAALATALAGAIAAAPDVAPGLPPAHARYEGALRATRDLLRSCRQGAPPAVMLEGAIGTAIVVNDQLDKAAAGQVWAAVRDGPCYRSAPTEVRAWADLFAAVAARDAMAMAELGTRLVVTAPNPYARDYALAAAAIGELARNRPEAARRVLDAHGKDLKAVWLDVLRGMAAKRAAGAAR